MGQKYEGTLIIQTTNDYSPVGSQTLAALENSAFSDDILSGKSLYSQNGQLLKGSFVDGWPIEIGTEEKMDAFTTLENVGRYVKYTGTASQGGGTPAPVNPIAVGDILESTAAGDAGHPILYLNTDVTPDFSQFPDEEMAGNEGYALLTLDENGGNTPFVVAQKMSIGTDIAYAIIASETSLYAYSETLDASSAGLSAWGWQVTSPAIISKWGGEAKVTAVNQQDVWGAYVSKDGQWTSGAKYTSGQVYKVAQNGDIAELKEIQY